MNKKYLFSLFILMELFLTGSLFYQFHPARGEVATTIVVNTTEDEYNHNGNCSLREAIIAANQNSAVDACIAGSGNDTIIIPAGTYNLKLVGTDDTALLGDLDLTGNVTLQGDRNTTTIINAGGASGINDRIFDIQSGATVSLSKMSIQSGNDNGWGGAGIRNQGTLFITNVLIIANSSCCTGGGLYNALGGVASLSHVSFGNNTANLGGAIHNRGELYLTQSALTFDTALNHGGGLYNEEGSVVLDEVNVESETAGINGGGIFNLSGNITISDSTIQKNRAISGDGGGIYGGWITITNSTLSANDAFGDGGGIYHGYKMNLTNVTLSQNNASGNGGGIYGCSFYAAKLLNVTLIGNSSSYGAGLFHDNSDGRNGELQVKNTILQNQSSNCAGTIASQGHNIDSGTTCGFNQPGDLNSTNPLVGALADNGGLTKTHALQPGSPAINAGDNSGCPLTDQRGFPRVGGCDIGAFEYLKRVFLPLILSK